MTARIIDPTYDFYPRSPCGERLGSVAVVSRTWNFYPRSPCGERRFTLRQRPPPLLFLSTLSLRRATYVHCAHKLSTMDFYPRSPCGERRVGLLSCFVRIIFLSTLSLRRATSMGVTVLGIQHNFYPRSPCGERRDVIAVITDAQSISIHALLAESDSKSAQNSGALLRI